MSNPATELTRVVVVGAGFGGIATVKALEGLPVAVTLVDSNNFHTFQPLLYQVATAGLDASDICFPMRRIFRDRSDVQVMLGTVTGFDLDRRTVTVDHNRVPALPQSSAALRPAGHRRRLGHQQLRGGGS